MKITTAQHAINEWTAIDEETYAGSGSPMGWGDTEEEAIEDLTEKLKEVFDGHDT
jgi:hypothetical protein